MDWKDRLNLPVSAQGEWAVKRFYGDPKLSAAYLPVAYFLLGELTSRMAKGNVSYGHRMLELPDGTKIRVLRDGERNILEITTFSTISSSVQGRPGAGGLVFFPRVNNVLMYPYSTPHATMSVKCADKNSPIEFTVTAPANKAYGNQFVFFGKDVYSWTHSNQGDLPVNYGGGNSVYKNGVLWHTLTHGITGFCPVEVEIPTDTGGTTTQMRYMVAASGAKVKDIKLITYIEQNGQLVVFPTTVDIFTDKSLLYNDRFWPCRFKKDGTEMAVIYEHVVTVQVEYTEVSQGYSYPPTKENRSRTSYGIARIAITMLPNEVKVVASYSDAGYRQDWSIRRGSYHALRKITQYPPGSLSIPSPEAQATSYSFHADETRTVEQTIDSVITFDDIELVYPAALAYKPKAGNTEELVVAYIKEYNDLSSESYSSSFSSERTVIDLQMSRPNTNTAWTVNVSKKEIFREYRVEQPARTGGDRKYQVVIGNEVLLGFQEPSGTTYDIVGFGDSYARLNAYDTQLYEYQETADHIGHIVIYTTFASAYLLYLDIRNDVGLLSYGMYKIVTTRDNIVHAMNQPGIPIDTRGESTEVKDVEEKNEFIFRRNGDIKHIGGPAITSSTTKTTAMGNPTSGDFNFAYPGESLQTYSGPYPINNLISGYTQSYDFSYVHDERPDCSADIWAYSIKCTIKGMQDPFIETVCTFGTVGQFLPVVDSAGEPTGEHLVDEDLTTHPIGIY